MWKAARGEAAGEGEWVKVDMEREVAGEVVGRSVRCVPMQDMRRRGAF